MVPAYRVAGAGVAAWKDRAAVVVEAVADAGVEGGGIVCPSISRPSMRRERADMTGSVQLGLQTLLLLAGGSAVVVVVKEEEDSSFNLLWSWASRIFGRFVRGFLRAWLFAGSMCGGQCKPVSAEGL